MTLRPNKINLEHYCLQKDLWKTLTSGEFRKAGMTNSSYALRVRIPLHLKVDECFKNFDSYFVFSEQFMFVFAKPLLATLSFLSCTADQRCRLLIRRNAIFLTDTSVPFHWRSVKKHVNYDSIWILHSTH